MLPLLSRLMLLHPPLSPPALRLLVLLQLLLLLLLLPALELLLPALEPLAAADPAAAPKLLPLLLLLL